jgi:hypothetical protein
VAGSYSGQVTAATLKATGAAIVSDTSTDGRGVYRDNTSYDLRLGGGTDSTDGAYISLSGAARGGSSSAYNGRVEYHAGGGVGSGQSGVLGDHVWYADNSSGSTVLMTLDSSTSNLTVGGHTNAQSSSTISASSKIDSADITTGAFRFYSTAGFRGGLGTGRWASGVTGTEVDLTLYVDGDNDFNIWTNNTNRATFNSTGLTVTGNLSVIYNGSASVRTYNGVLKSDFLENSAGANHLTIRTESGGNKNVIIDPDGTGITQIYGNLSVSGNGVVKQISSNAYATSNLNNWYTGSTATLGEYYRYDSTYGHFQDAAGNVASNAPNTLTQSPTQIYSYGALLTLGTTNNFRGQFYMAHSASEIYWRSGWGSSGDQNWTRLVGDRNIQSILNATQIAPVKINGASDRDWETAL